MWRDDAATPDAVAIATKAVEMAQDALTLTTICSRDPEPGTLEEHADGSYTRQARVVGDSGSCSPVMPVPRHPSGGREERRRLPSGRASRYARAVMSATGGDAARRALVWGSHVAIRGKMVTRRTRRTKQKRTAAPPGLHAKRLRRVSWSSGTPRGSWARPRQPPSTTRPRAARRSFSSRP